MNSLAGGRVVRGLAFVACLAACGDDGSHDTGVATSPTSVVASDGTSTELVSVQWSAADHATSYRVFRDDVLAGTTTSTSFDDTTASGGSIVAGTASASQGAFATHVALFVSGAGASPGPTARYTVTAVNDAGESAASSSDTGFRGVGTLTYQWQRSTDDADGGYADIAGAAGASYDDVDAPSNGAGRWYRARINSSGAVEMFSSATRGFRSVAPPTKPTDVVASDGTSAAHVTVSWTPAATATTYRIYRDGVQIADTATPQFDDVGAGAGGPAGIPGTFTATQGTKTDRVTLAWTPSVSSPGTTHNYTVTAVNAAGESAPSTADSGFRAPFPVTYELSIDGGSYVSIGASATYDDLAAPAGTLSIPSGVASDGASLTLVSLRTTTVVASPGATRSYAVRAVNTAAMSSSVSTTGYRGVGAAAYQWQRSATDANTGYADLAGATANTFDDTTAPAGLAGRWYRCVVSASGASSVTSIPDRGFRAVAPRLKDFWVTDGEVSAIAADSSAIYIGGGFSYVGPPTGSFVGVDTSTGKPNIYGPRVQGAVSASVSDGAGGWYIAGSFTSIDGVARNALAHILANGTLDLTFDLGLAPSSVSSLALSGGILYVGGSFTSIGGQARNRIAAVDADGAVTSWNPGADGFVGGLLLIGTRVYARGSFTTIGGQARSGVAALDTTTGLATTWVPGIANPTTMAAYETTIYLAQSGRIDAVDATTAATNWSTVMVGTASAIVSSGTRVYIGGSFTSVQGIGRSNLAALDPATGTLLSWVSSPFGGSVSALALDESSLFVGGSFVSLQGQEHRHFGAVDANTGLPISWIADTSGNVSSLSVANGNVYVGGVFSSLGGVQRAGVAAIDPVSGSATSWDGSPGGGAGDEVLALALDATRLYIGGTDSQLYAVDRTTGVITWADDIYAGALGDPGGTIRALAVSGSTLYVGGGFDRLKDPNVPRNRIGAVNASTGALLPWNPDASSLVTALTVSGSVVYAGGNFLTIGGQTRHAIAALDATTAAATAWDPNGSNLTALALSGSTLFVGGQFSSIGGQARNRLSGISTTTGAPSSWTPSPDSFVYSLAADATSLYVGGEFTTIAGQPRGRIASFDAGTTALRAWNPTFDARVGAIAIVGSRVYVGGRFTTVNGVPQGRFAAFEP